LQRREAEQCERAAEREVGTASGHIVDASANGRAYRHLDHADEERRASLRRTGDTSLDPDTAAQGQRAIFRTKGTITAARVTILKFSCWPNCFAI
jgi:hypothetical protein